MASQKLLSIVVPVFNEKQFISQTLTRICQADSLDYKKEIILIDDGSTDGTKAQINDIIPKLRSKYRSIIFKTIFNPTNQGKGAALKKGFPETSGQIVLIQDADLEYDPQDYPYLLEPFIYNDCDVVYGSRFISNRPHRVLYFWHSVLNNLLTSFSNMLTDLNLTDMETGYKVFKGPLIREVAPKLQSRRFGFEPEITARIAKHHDLKIFEVGISYSGRTYKEGKKIGWQDGIKALWQIIKFNLP